MRCSENKNHVFLMVAAAYAVSSYLHDILKALVANRFMDFAYYYVLAKLFFQGYNIWNTSPALIAAAHSLAGTTGFGLSPTEPLNSPGFFFLMAPFVILPFKAASIVWVVFSQAAFFVGVFLLINKVFKKIARREMYYAIFLIFSAWPLREDLVLGQSNVLIAVFFVLAVILLRHGSLIAGGMFVGLGIQVKEFFLFMLVLLAIRRYWKALAGALAVLLVPRIALMAFGGHYEAAYWLNVLERVLHKSAADPFVLSSWTFASSAQSAIGVAFVTPVLVAANIAIIAIACRLIMRIRTTADTLPLESAYFIMVCIAVSPYLHEAHMAVIWLPLAVYWFSLRDGIHARTVLFVAAYLLLALKFGLTSFHYFDAGLPHLLSYGKLLGIYILLFLIFTAGWQIESRPWNISLRPATTTNGFLPKGHNSRRTISTNR